MANIHAGLWVDVCMANIHAGLWVDEKVHVVCGDAVFVVDRGLDPTDGAAGEISRMPCATSNFDFGNDFAVSFRA